MIFSSKDCEKIIEKDLKKPLTKENDYDIISPLSREIRATAHCGLVVQLVRTLACHARGQGFESPSGRHYADLAHLVERNLAKVEVAGSIPVIRSNTWVR